MASHIPRNFIDDLLARVDLVEIIGARVQLRKVGGNYKALCPFHTEKTPSFTVNASQQFYHCFGCGAHGNAIGFLMQYDRLDFVEAIAALAAHLGLEVPQEFGSGEAQINKEKRQKFYDLLAKVSTFFREQLAKSEKAKAYLKTRGLSEEICERFALGFAPAIYDKLQNCEQLFATSTELLLGNGLLKRDVTGIPYTVFRNRLMFPIRNRQGQIIAFGGRSFGDEQPKYLNSPETAIFHKGYELYGLYEARQTRRSLPRIIVVEGYMDVIALTQYGIEGVVATMGTAITGRQVQLLLREDAEIIFCFDGDVAGQHAAWRALEIILPLMRDGIDIRFLFLPEGEDPDSYVRKQGNGAFDKLVATATTLTDFFFAKLNSKANLSTLSGRASLAKKAKGLLERMPNGVFKELLLQKLAQLVHIDLAELKNINFAKERGLSKDATSLAKAEKNTPKVIEIAISLLLCHPALAKEITDLTSIEELDLPNNKLLIWLWQLLNQEQDIKVGAILQRCQNAEDAEYLATLAAKPPLIPLPNLKNELLGAIEKLNKYATERTIEKLLTKASQEGLTLEEKRLLQKLILQNKK